MRAVGLTRIVLCAWWPWFRDCEQGSLAVKESFNAETRRAQRFADSVRRLGPAFWLCVSPRPLRLCVRCPVAEDEVGGPPSLAQKRLVDGFHGLFAFGEVHDDGDFDLAGGN